MNGTRTSHLTCGTLQTMYGPQLRFDVAQTTGVKVQSPGLCCAVMYVCVFIGGQHHATQKAAQRETATVQAH